MTRRFTFLALLLLSVSAPAQERRQMIARFRSGPETLTVVARSSGRVAIVVQGVLLTQEALFSPGGARSLRGQLDSVGRLEMHPEANEELVSRLDVVGHADTYVRYVRRAARGVDREHLIGVADMSHAFSTPRVSVALTRRQFAGFLRALDSAAAWTTAHVSPVDRDRNATAAAVVGDLSLGGASSTNDPYFEFQVDKQAQLTAESPRPRYPDSLRSTHIVGEVLAQFVVDTTGRVDLGTVKVLSATNDDFARALKEAMPTMRFFPAERARRKVAQMVQQPFTFPAPDR